MDWQSASFARQIQPLSDDRFARNRLARPFIASRARAAATMRETIASAVCLLLLSQFSTNVRTAPSTSAVTSGIVEPLFGLALELRFVDVAAQDRQQTFTDVLGGELETFGKSPCVSTKLRTPLLMPALSPFSCVPPDGVGMPLTKLLMLSSVPSVPKTTAQTASSLRRRRGKIEPADTAPACHAPSPTFAGNRQCRLCGKARRFRRLPRR